MYTTTLRRWLRAEGVRCLPWILERLPETAGRELCSWIGRGGHLLVGRDRHLARENLSRVYPEWSEDRVNRFARAVFEEIGRNAFDFVRYPSLPPDRRRALVRMEGADHLESVREQGCGAIAVTGHLGCWEILAADLVARGVPLKALARPLREARLDAILRRHRERMGVMTLSSRALPVAAVRHLRQGGFLGVLADQRIREGGLEVSFLGQPTRMTDAPARLALAANVPILPMGIHRVAGSRHVAKILPPIRAAGGKETVGMLTQAVADALGQLIRLAPEQWIWIHPRWESSPGPQVGIRRDARVPVGHAARNREEKELCASR